MEKISKIVSTLNDSEYEELQSSVSAKSNDKISILLSLARNQVFDDKQIIETLQVKPNAYFTLKSRLNQKIENFLVGRIGAPKMDLVKKVVSFSDLLMQMDREVAIVTLKKLEKECIDYDLPFELIKIYQYLKKLTIFRPDSYFAYSQAYNKSVAYALSIDKAEDYVATYFKTYGDYFLSRNSIDLDKLALIRRELETLSDSYDSHRLFVFRSIVNAFHILFVEDKTYVREMTDVSDLIAEIDNIFYKYQHDAQYRQLQTVLTHIQFEYYFKLGLYRRAEVFYQQLNYDLPNFLNHYNSYTFPCQFLFSKMMMFKMNNQLDNLLEEDEAIFDGFEPIKAIHPMYVSFVIYRGTCMIHAGKYREALDLFNELRNNISFKNYDHAEMEIKLLMATIYALQNEKELCNHLIKSNQRSIRNNVELSYENARYFMKILTKLIFHPDTDDEKLLKYYDHFQNLNNGKDQVLGYLDANRILFKIERAV